MRSLAEALSEYLERLGRPIRWVAEQTELLFGGDGVPYNTISRWANGEVKKPRNWDPLLKVAVVLDLSPQEADGLLTSAGHLTIKQLKEQTDDPKKLKLLNRFKPKAPSLAPAKPILFIHPNHGTSRIKSILCRPSGARICCLYGAGGSGKTYLATVAAYDLEDKFPDGILWTTFGDDSNVKAILSYFAERLGCTDINQYPDLSSRTLRFRELIAEKSVLIILDNVQNPAQVAPFIPARGNSSLLITTREYHHEVAGLGEMVEIRGFDPLGQESLRLYEEILGRDCVRNNRADFSMLADLLDHLPIAISLTANLIKEIPGLTAEKLVAELKQTLSHPDPNGESPFPSLEALFSNIIGILGDKHKLLLASLSLFNGQTVTPTAASYLWEKTELETTNLLRRFYMRSLLQADQPGRYRLHNVWRAFLLKQPISQRYTKRMIEYYVEFTEAHRKDFDAIAAEYDNIIGAMNRAIEQAQNGLYVRLAHNLYPYLSAFGLYETTERLLRQAIPFAQSASMERVEIQLEYYLGRTYSRLGQADNAEQQYERALTLAQTRDDLAYQCATLTSLGASSYRRGRFTDSVTRYEEALSIAERIPDENRAIALITNLGLIATAQGEELKAEELFEKALNRAREHNNPKRLIAVLQNYGDLHEQKGNYEKATAFFEEGYELAKASQNQELISRLLGNLGSAALGLGTITDAKAYFGEGLKISKKIGHLQQQARHYANLGKTFTQQQQYEQAGWHFRDALERARISNFSGDLSTILIMQGESQLKAREPLAAEKSFVEAEQLAEQNQLPKQLADSRLGRAQTAHMRGDTQSAKQLGKQSLSFYEGKSSAKAKEVIAWVNNLS